MHLSYSDPATRALYYRLPAFLKDLVAATYSLWQHSSRFGEIFAAQLAELERDRYRSAEEIREDQLTRLKQILVHAGSNVPYYGQLFKETGFEPSSVESLEDLRRIPLLDKETVGKRRSELIARSGVGATVATHTSGTTGKGLQLRISQKAYQRSYACVWFHYGWAGIRRGDRIATLAGHPVAAPNSMRPPFWLRDRVEDELIFSSQHIAPSTLPLYADALADFRPALVRGYPSSIYLLALYLLAVGRTDLRPKAVYTSSETLLDFQRRVMEQAFACRVYSYYGNTERVAHLLECREGNFHVLTETCVVEVLKPDGSAAAPGEMGEMVCTSLLDTAMPLIRYQVGDTGVAAAGLCSCGFNTPILSSIIGRVEDIVVTPEGRHVGRLDHAFKDMVNVKEAQILQEDVNSIQVKIVPREGFGPADARALVRELRLRLGEQIGIRLETVDHIARTASGKFRFVGSKVPIQIGSLANPSLSGTESPDDVVKRNSLLHRSRG
ncbi:MAG: hypothetical protein M1565_08270 [Actinobacteria bacterium]|nr:hypothetical protein [Actinomycetota bacterium]